MGLLDNVERGLERAVNGVFAKTFRSRLQPLEIFSALKGELDANTRVLSRDAILVPDRLTVRVSRADFERLAPDGSALVDQFVRDLRAYAHQQRYQFPGPVTVTIVPDDSLTVGMLEVDSRMSAGDVTLVPALEVQGRVHPLRQGVTTIGRSHDCDITIADSAVSKRHASITRDGDNVVLRDLGSTNGTKVGVERITLLELTGPLDLVIGATPVRYLLAPKAVG